MLRIITGSLIVIFLLFALSSFVPRNPKLTSDHSVYALLEAFGDTPLPHKANLTLEGASAARGKDIVIKGMSEAAGKKSKRQSKHFTCISCHNIEKEDPDLANPNPEARLKYVSEHNMPFLQGSALYGSASRYGG